jgi:hypothetical protein
MSIPHADTLFGAAEDKNKFYVNGLKGIDSCQVA